MSTRSYICMEQKDGSYVGIYCHSDGYITYNGAILIDHYQDREKVEKLISLGHLSSLAENIDPDPRYKHSFDYRERQQGVCVFYGRDRGELDQGATPITLESLAQDPWIEYVYCYGQDGKWRFFEDNKYQGKESLLDVKEKLGAYFKGIGIERPMGMYGFFDEKAIRIIKKKQEEEALAHKGPKPKDKEKDKDDKIKD